MTGSTWRWTALHAAVVAGFLVAAARYYHPGTGFTSMIQMPADAHDGYEIARVRDAPHAHVAKGGYDGQYYAELAVDPLLRDPAIDRALDNAPYRARRILFSWTAWAAGLGQPAWILQAYALQNIVCWLALASLLTRWFPVGTPRAFVLWTCCLLTHGLLISVRAALLDGPSVLLIASAAALAERDRRWSAAAVIGVSGLAREANLVSGVMLARGLDRTWRSWLRLGLGLAICLVPLLVWVDYLRSIYFTFTTGGADQFAMPFESLRWKLQLTLSQIGQGGLSWTPLVSLSAVVAFLVQGGYAVWCLVRRREPASVWPSVAVMFLLLGLTTSHPVWEGTPGPITRVTLPLAVGFNVLARRASWPVVALGNLTVLAGVVEFWGV